MAILDTQTDAETGVVSQTAVVGDGITHSVTIPKDSTDPLQTDDAQMNVAISSAGIETFGNDFLGNEFEEWFVQFDDLGRPVSRVNFDDITLGAKCKVYGDGSYWRQHGFSQDITGYITLSGLVAVLNSADPIVNGTVIATLPSGFAPNVAEMFICGSNIGPVRIDVLPTGEIKYNGTGSITQYVSLSGIRFVAPQS